MRPCITAVLALLFSTLCAAEEQVPQTDAAKAHAHHRAMYMDHHATRPGTLLIIRRQGRGRDARILTPEESRKLEIQPVPTSQPIPLIIGHYWRCIQSPGGFESCEPVLVVCDDEQTICTEH